LSGYCHEKVICCISWRAGKVAAGTVEQFRPNPEWRVGGRSVCFRTVVLTYMM
jgi:hypothetical protein